MKHILKIPKKNLNDILSSPNLSLDDRCLLASPNGIFNIAVATTPLVCSPEYFPDPIAHLLLEACITTKPLNNMMTNRGLRWAQQATAGGSVDPIRRGHQETRCRAKMMILATCLLYTLWHCRKDKRRCIEKCLQY